MQAKNFLLLLALIALPQASSAIPSSTELQTQLKNGDVCLENNKINDAIGIYKSVIHTQPNSSIAHQHLALAFELNNELNLAEIENQKAINLDPKNVAAHYQLGKLLAIQRNYPEAAHQEALALQLDPKNVQAYLAFGVILVKMGDYERAIQASFKAIELDPNNQQAYLNLAVTFGRKGNYDKAALAYKKVLELNPNSAAAHLGLGDTLGKLKDLPEQIQQYKTAAALAPQNDNVHGSLGWALYKNGNLQGAISEGVITNWLRMQRSGPTYLQYVLSLWGAIFLFFGLLFAVLIFGSRFKAKDGETVTRSFFLVLYNDKPGRLVLTNMRLVFVPEAFSRWFGADVKFLYLNDLNKTASATPNSLAVTCKDGSIHKFLMPNLVLKPLIIELDKLNISITEQGTK